MRALLCKTIITIADILFKPLPQVQVVLYTISCGLIFYYHTRMVSAQVASYQCWLFGLPLTQSCLLQACHAVLD
jgi:hypothetical protein